MYSGLSLGCFSFPRVFSIHGLHSDLSFVPYDVEEGIHGGDLVAAAKNGRLVPTGVLKERRATGVDQYDAHDPGDGSADGRAEIVGQRSVSHLSRGCGVQLGHTFTRGLKVVIRERREESVLERYIAE